MQEQAAGRPVVKIEAAAGKGGLGGQAVGAAGALKKCFIAGHGTGQGELGKEVVVLFTQAEHQRQRAGGRNAQRAGIGCASQHGSTVLKGGKLHGIRGICLRLEYAPKCKHKVLGSDGVIRGSALDGLVGQAVLDLEGVGLAIGGDRPALGQIGHDLAIRFFADKPAVKVLAGDHVRGSRSHLRVEVCGNGIHEPCKAWRTGTAAAAGERKQERSSKHCCGNTEELFQGDDLILWYLRKKASCIQKALYFDKCSRNSGKIQLQNCEFTLLFGAKRAFFRCQLRLNGL